MAKRGGPDPRQIDLFATSAPLTGPAAHAGIEAWVATEVARILREDPRSRQEISGAMSAAMCEDVSHFMLDAWASPARDTHNISFARAIALLAVTGSTHLIEEAVNRLGGRILWGEEINAARLGHLLAQRARLDSEILQLKRGGAQPIERGERP